MAWIHVKILCLCDVAGLQDQPQSRQGERAWSTVRAGHHDPCISGCYKLAEAASDVVVRRDEALLVVEGTSQPHKVWKITDCRSSQEQCSSRAIGISHASIVPSARQPSEGAVSVLWCAGEDRRSLAGELICCGGRASASRATSMMKPRGPTRGCMLTEKHVLVVMTGLWRSLPHGEPITREDMPE